MQVTVEIEGAKELIASFKMVEDGITDLHKLKAWDAVQQQFYKIEREQFNSEGGAGQSGKWKDLTSPYKERKATKWGNVPILQASGALFKSLTSGRAQGAIVEKKPMELTLGTSIPYAAYHQTGTRRMAARPPLSFTPEQEQTLLEPVVSKLRQLIDNAKLRDIRGF